MELLDVILKELERLKLRDIRQFHSGGKSIIADHFFVATSDSIIQMEAVRSNLVDFMKSRKIALKNNLEEWHGGWLLLDFNDIIIHIFLEERRSFFQIDRLLESSDFDLQGIKEYKTRQKKVT